MCTSGSGHTLLQLHYGSAWCHQRMRLSCVKGRFTDPKARAAAGHSAGPASAAATTAAAAHRAKRCAQPVRQALDGMKRTTAVSWFSCRHT